MQFNLRLNSLKSYIPEPTREEIAKRYHLESQEIIMLASNENPYGFSPKITQALSQMTHQISRYPDDNATDLKEALATHYKIKQENLIIGCGSDEIIDFCIQAKCHSDSKILTAGVTFGMYEIYANRVGARVVRTKSQMHCLEEFLELYKKEQPEIIFLCLPNNPLGECLDFEDVLAFLKQINSDTLVVLDGAYQEFARLKDSRKAIDISRLKIFDNVIYLGTFSKAYGLAGLRIGYGIASEEIIQALYKVRAPYNFSHLSASCAILALQDKEFLQQCVKKILKSMEEYELFFKNTEIEFVPSYANFITFFCKKHLDCSDLATDFCKNGVLLKSLKTYGMNAVRLTIGTEEQNKKVFSLLKEKIY